MATKLNIDAIIDKSIPSSKLEDAIFQGTYDNMTVGNADFARDLTGRNEATPQEFNFQPSAGDMSIKDETAVIKRVKGNSVVWNQLFRVGTNVTEKNGITITWDNTGKLTIKGTATEDTTKDIGRAQIVNGQKYAYYGLVSNSQNASFYWYDQTPAIDSGNGIITTPNYTDDRYFVFRVSKGDTIDITFYPKVTNLTQMFGAGNEPTTIEEFYARIPSGKLFDINAYNPGEIVPLRTTAIKTVGFNQWDEQWELGFIKGEDGTNGGYVANYIRSKNYIPVIGGMYYFINRPANTSDCQVYCYDRSKNFISHYSNGRDYPTQIPLNTAYVRFYLYYGAEVYHNDICVNLSHTGYRNGEYEPYKEYIRELPAIKKYFPYGMCKAGSVYDEIYFDESKQKWVAVKRVGVVDLGSLNWTFYSDYNSFAATQFYPLPKLGFQGVCNKYPFLGRIYDKDTDKACGYIFNTTINVRDSSYTDAASFKQAMQEQGVMLYYELAEPFITEIDDVVDFDYYVEDFGTEEALLLDTPFWSAPFSADIVYQFNAVDRIRQNDVKIEILDKKLDTKISEIIYGGTW